MYINAREVDTPSIHPPTTTVSFNYSGNNTLVFKSGDNYKRLAQRSGMNALTDTIGYYLNQGYGITCTALHYKCQAVSRWPVRTEALVRSHITPCGTGTGFPPSTAMLSLSVSFH